MQATNASQNAAIYRWQAKGMEDSVKTDTNPTCKAATLPGTYNVKLTASKTNERSATAVVPVRIGRRALTTVRLTAVPATITTAPPANRNEAGSGSYTTQYNGWVAVAEVETR